MMTPTRRGWQWDWAGRHGTAWGTINACLTTISLSVVGHLVQQHWPLPLMPTVLVAVGVAVLAVLWVLLRASVGRPRPRATVAYQMCCYAGSGGWVAWTIGHESWSWRWWLTSVGVLGIAAVVAGALASLADEIDDRPAAEPGQPKSDTAQRERNARAVELETLLRKVGAPDGVEVLGIEDWPRRNGYTVEGTTGGQPWKSVAELAPKVQGELDLPEGCTVTGRKGISARRWLLEIMTRNYLAEDNPYPTTYAAHSINDDLTVGTTNDGRNIGPNLRSACMVVAGETGSGKSNAGGVLAAEIITTTDALLWMWELTGGNLWNGWMAPWLRGDVKVPPIDWCAFDGRELLLQSRAALRIGYARKAGYRELQIQVDDDKLPVSPQIPAVIVAGDEITSVTGHMSQHPEAQENIRRLIFELRSAAVRAILLALRGTSDVLIESIQSQCAVRAVMKVGSPAEAGWIMGRHTGFGPEDTPYPGCGGISLASGVDLIALKWRRLRPSQMREIAVAVQGRRPVLDDLSRLAANGRHADGTPMGGLLDGELDCYETRWERFRAFYAAGSAAVVAEPQSATSGSLADLKAAMAQLDEAVGAVQVDDADAEVEATRREFEALMRAQGWNGVDLELLESPAEPPALGWQDRVEAILRAAGAKGVGPAEVLATLASDGVPLHRDTLHAQLREWLEAGKVVKPRYGRWRWAG